LPRVEIPVLRIDGELGTVATAVVNLIERVAHQKLSAQHAGLPSFLTTTVRVSEATWKAVLHLTLNVNHGERPPATLAVAVTPMTRTILESLMAVVFVLDAPADRLDWYHRAGWRDEAERLARLSQKHSSAPEWGPYLEGIAEWLALHNKDLGISASEQLDPKSATDRWKNINRGGYWPNPGKMRGLTTDPVRANFLTFLNTWFYSGLSGDSHLSYMGLVRRGSVLRDEHAGLLRDNYLSKAVLDALTLWLSLLSEIVVSASLTSQVQPIRAAWDLVKPHLNAEEVWVQRYDALLVSGAQA